MAPNQNRPKFASEATVQARVGPAHKVGQCPRDRKDYETAGVAGGHLDAAHLAHDTRPAFATDLRWPVMPWRVGSLQPSR